MKNIKTTILTLKINPKYYDKKTLDEIAKLFNAY